MSFQHVIVAFDGTPQGADALTLALRLRKHGDGDVTLACVVTGERWHAGPETHRPDAIVPEEIASMFTEARSAVPPGIHLRQRAPVAPSPARGLTELAESENADLIVIGSSRHGEPGRIRLERTAGRLLEGALCAVAIAPGGLRETGAFRHVGIAFDDSPEGRGALLAGYDVAAGCGAAVSVIHAVPAGAPDTVLREARRRGEAALEAAARSAPDGVDPRTFLLHGAPGDILREACDGVVDLLVTGSRGYDAIQRALLGSVSDALTEGAPYPVLVVPPPARDAPATSAAGHRLLQVRR